MERASVVVVGGGVIGTSIAFHLAEAGVEGVLLLERGDLGSGSTGKGRGRRAWLERAEPVLRRRAPILLDAPIAGGWWGDYEMTPDHKALIGEAAAPPGRFLYATGFSGHGFQQAPAIGEILRDMVLGEDPFVDVSPLSADRFARGATRP